jgi:hypothetical protein
MELLGCNRVRITFGFPLLSLTFAISIPNDSIDIPLFSLKSFTHFPYFNLWTAIFLYFEDDLLFVFLFYYFLSVTSPDFSVLITKANDGCHRAHIFPRSDFLSPLECFLEGILIA